MLRTAITERWGLRWPLIQAPMAGVAGGALAAAVGGSGGMGFIGAGPGTPPDWIAREAELVRGRCPFGIGLLAWVVAQEPEQFEAALAAAPAVIALSVGDVAPYIERCHAAGIQVVTQVSSAAAARRAVADGVDAVVAQGTEAGGHTGRVATLPLLQAVLTATDGSGVPVLAGGGIGTGRAVAGVLTMGAAAAWMGTRFVASEEALGTAGAKARLVASDETQTIHTHVFDVLQRLAWPDAYPGRALVNAMTDRWHGREPELVEALASVRPEFEDARHRRDYEIAHVYAGQAVGVIDTVEPAAAIVQRLAAETAAALRAAQALLAQ